MTTQTVRPPGAAHDGHVEHVEQTDKVDVVPGRVYVWEIPVRLTHWINVLSIVMLSFSGYYIGRPYLSISPQEAYSSFFMGNMRLIHFLFGYIFLGSLMLRTYWAFVGNRWASWRTLVPFFTAEGRGYMVQSFKFYTFMQRKPPVMLGHNALAGFTYAFIVGFYFLQVFTGFALYGLADPGGFWNTLTGWSFLLVDPQMMRLIHHIIMWLLLGFVIQHVYSAFLVDAEESNGVLSSIFTGYKFLVPDSPGDDIHPEHYPVDAGLEKKKPAAAQDVAPREPTTPDVGATTGTTETDTQQP